MSGDTSQQLLRIGLNFVGGLLVGKGYLTEELATTAVGATLSLANVLWWTVWNSGRAR